MTLLHRQVLELQAQAEGARAVSTRVVELEVELQDTVFSRWGDIRTRPRLGEKGVGKMVSSRRLGEERVGTLTIEFDGEVITFNVYDF